MGSHLKTKGIVGGSSSLWRLALTATFGLWALPACTPAEFGSYGADPLGFGQGGAPAVICDPFDSGNAAANSGLKGSIHYLTERQKDYRKSADVIRDGKRVNADLFLNSVFVPTRLFDTGFVTQGGAVVVDDAGDPLIEYFGLDLYSRLKLGSGEAEGDYQLAVLADDGATLSLDDGRGGFVPVVDNEGIHSTRFACAQESVGMNRQTRLGLHFQYFQGPRMHIAAILLWRKIDRKDANALHDEECGREGTNHFFQVATATSPAVPKEPYLGMLRRGWKPLSVENFELVSGTNRCAKRN